MPTYFVEVAIEYEDELMVEAESEEEAIRIAEGRANYLQSFVQSARAIKVTQATELEGVANA